MMCGSAHFVKNKISKNNSNENTTINIENTRPR